MVNHCKPERVQYPKHHTIVLPQNKEGGDVKIKKNKTKHGMVLPFSRGSLYDGITWYYLGQQISVKCAESMWITKSGGIHHLHFLKLWNLAK